MGSRVSEARAFLVKQIRAGMPPGAGVSVKVATKELRISHTPVREALERLVGEGVLVSIPGRNGFATPRLTVRDLTNLHRLHGALLLGLNRTDRRKASTWRPDPADPSGAVEEAIAQGCGPDSNTMILGAIKAAELRLATYRRVEPNVVPEWPAGLLRLRNGLAEGGGAGRDAITDFTAARVTAADALMAAIEDLYAISS